MVKTLSQSYLWKCTLVRTLAFRLPLPLRTFFAASLAFEAAKINNNNNNREERQKGQHQTDEGEEEGGIVNTQNHVHKEIHLLV